MASVVTLGTVGIRPSATDNASQVRDDLTYTIQPGTSVSDSIDLVNNTDAVAHVHVYGADSTPSSDGTFAVKQEAESQDNIGSWVQLSQNDVDVPPHAISTVPFTLTVPSTLSADQREYQGGIMLEQESTDLSDVEGIILSTRTGVRVYVTIPGDIQQSAQVTRFSVSPLAGDPNILDVTTAIQNTGNVTQNVTLVIEYDMENAWERFTAFQSLPARTELRVQVLPGQTLVRHQTIARPWAGVLHAQAHLVYETNTGEDSVTTSPVSVICVPPWYVLLISGLYICLLIYSLIRRAIRKHAERLFREHHTGHAK